jgi:hypothetical protein
MIFTLIILLIVVILVWLFKPINTNATQISYPNINFIIDSNYSGLKKMFFYPYIQDFNFDYKKRYNSVYGVLIEQSIIDDIDENHPFLTKKNKKILFASYITGFAGYYDNFGEGYIGGKFYSKNDMGVQSEVMELHSNRNLDGIGLDIKIRKLSTRLILKANKLINHSFKDAWETIYNDEVERFKIYLKTKSGVYTAEVLKSEINNSIWKEVIEDSQTILKLLEREKFKAKLEENIDGMPF